MVNKKWYIRVANGDPEKIFPTLKDSGIEGAFITAPLDAYNSADRLAASLPCVALGSLVIPKVSPYITADSVKAGRLAAEHFLALGLRNFAYFSTITDVFWSKERFAGFSDRLREAGYEAHAYDPGERRPSTRDWQPGQTWIRGLEEPVKWLRSLPKPVGLMVPDDSVGYDIIEAMEENGIKVPEEVAVVGMYNDEGWCNTSRPPLSSIEVNVQKAGYEAAELLNAIITGQEKMNGQAIVAEVTKVVARQSSEILAITDPDVSAAVHFIRTHFHLPIQVADVVGATTTSRRGLEVKFRHLLNRSIFDEVMRMRLDHIADMLIKSDLSIDRVAAASTFGSTGHMSRLFKKHKGLSPRDFRRAHRTS